MLKKTRVCKALALAFGGGLTGLTLGALPAFAQTAQLDRVEITGSSIKRVESEGALQVQIITRTEIDRLGVQTTEQLLQTVSAMSSSGQTQNSTGVSLSTYGASGVSLRGLGEERTLVLLNGRRLAAFAGGGGASVNVNNIPLAAIERVEILKDGASAIYGSDAVAGVVNFILTKNFQGLQIGGTYGTPTESGGGQQYQVNVVGGFGDLSKDRYNLTLGYQYSNNTDLFGRDRAFAANGNLPGTFVNAATGQGNIQGHWIPGVGPGPGYSAGSASQSFGNPLAALGKCADIKMFDAGTTTLDKPYCQYDSSPDVGLLGASTVSAFTGNFVFKLNENAELFMDGVYSRSVATTTYQPSPVRTSFLLTDDEFARQGIDPVLLLRPFLPSGAPNPNYQLASDYFKANGLAQLDGKPIGVTDRTFLFGPRTNEDTSTQSRLVIGVRGDVLGQDYNVGVAQNQSRVSGSVTNGYFSQVAYAKATQDPASDWNPWAPTQSAAFLAAVAPARYAGPTLDAASRSTNFDATISGSVVSLPAGDMAYAAGYQYRKENLQLNPSAALLSGDIAGLGGATKPIDESRNITGLFGELNIPVIKNLDLNLAARYDKYSDVGSTSTYKGNLRYQPIDAVLLRGSYGTGFRAPTLTDLWTPQTLGTSAQFNDPAFPGADGRDLQVNEFGGGNSELKPETSRQWSLGGVWQAMPSLSIGVDYFNIEIANVISKPTTQFIVNQNFLGNPAYKDAVVRDVGGNIVTTTALLLNTGTMKSEGLDFDIRYRENLGPGRLDIGLNSTYYIKFDQSQPDAPTSHKVGTICDGTPVCNPVVPSTAGLDGVGVVLRYKQYLSATWTQGAWATTLANQYGTGYHTGVNDAGNLTDMGYLSTWDLQVAWAGIKNLNLTFGARNIFNQGTPDFFIPASNQFQTGYDASQYDPRGRFVYMTAAYKF